MLKKREQPIKRLDEERKSIAIVYTNILLPGYSPLKGTLKLQEGGAGKYSPILRP
jgi:hypothetical protein